MRSERWVMWLPMLPALLAVTGHAAAFSGTVTRVSDGDTVWLRPLDHGAAPRKPVKVRMLGIDAPELCQPWGERSRDALAMRVMGRKVEAAPRGRDDHGRTLAPLLLDGEDVGAWMVAQGHAWSARWRGDRGPYARHEDAARRERRGLFSLPDPMQPYHFRRFHGPCR